MTTSKKLKERIIIAILVSVMVWQPSFGQTPIIADSNLEKGLSPTIGAAPNGVPLVDIVKPNASGLSHNKYQNFNVDDRGAILNNYKGEFGRSFLGGITPGNPNLNQSNSATIILNEVTSMNRSQLEGAIEVFGSKADVVIANPNGITCNGCGFINTPRASLTTGAIELGEDGSLKGFNVKGGEILFGEKGANLSSGKGSVDLFDVVSRTIKINGPISGHDINLTAGTGTFNYKDRHLDNLTDLSDKPEYAIDGSQLGALQAGRIKMVATEKGVGVRMRNDMAANTGEILLSADGKIILNNLSSRKDAKVQSSNSDIGINQITSKNTVQLKAKTGVNAKKVVADQDIIIESGTGNLTLLEQATSGRDLTLVSLKEINAKHISSVNNTKITVSKNLKLISLISNNQVNIKVDKGDIFVDDKISSQGQLNIFTLKGDLNAKNLFSFGSINLNIGKSLLIEQNLIAEKDISVQAHHNIVAPLIASGVDIADLIAKNTLQFKGIKHSVITSENDSITIGNLYSSGDSRLKSADDIAINNAGLSQGQLNISAKNNVTAELLASGVDLNRFINTNTLAFSTPQVTNITTEMGTITLNNLYSSGDSQLKSANDIAINNAGLSQGQLNISAKNNVTAELLASGVDLNRFVETNRLAFLTPHTTNIITDKGTIAIDDLYSSGDSRLKSADRIIIQNAGLSQGQLNISAKNNVTVKLLASGVDLNFFTDNNKLAFSTPQATNIITDTGTIAIDDLYSSGDSQLKSANDIAINNAGLSQGQLNIFAKNNVTAELLASGVDLNLFIDNNKLAFSTPQATNIITDTGTIAIDDLYSSGDSQLKSANDIAINNVGLSQGQLNISAKNNVTAELLASGVDLNLFIDNNKLAFSTPQATNITTEMGTITLNNLYSSGDSQLKSANDIAINNAGLSQGQLNIFAKNNVTAELLASGVDLNRFINTNTLVFSTPQATNITTNTGTIAINNLYSSGDSQLKSANDIAINNVGLSQGQLNIFAKNNVTAELLASGVDLNRFINTNTLAFSTSQATNITTKTGTITLNNLYSSGDSRLKSADDIAINNAGLSQGQLNISAKNNVTAELLASGVDLNRFINTNTLAFSTPQVTNITTEMGTITLNNLYSSGDSQLKSANDIAINNAGLSQGQLNISAKNNVTAKLLASGVDLNKTFLVNNLIFNDKGALTLQALNGSINAENLSSATTLTANASSIINIANSIIGQGHINLTAQTIHGKMIRAGSDSDRNKDQARTVTLNALKGDIILETLLASGTIDLNAHQTITISKQLYTLQNANLTAQTGAINLTKFYSGGRTRLWAEEGLSLKDVYFSKMDSLFKGKNINLTQATSLENFIINSQTLKGQKLISYKNSTINAKDINIDTVLTGGTLNLTATRLSGQTFISGINFQKTAENKDGNIVLNPQGDISLNIADNVNVATLYSAKNLTLLSGGDIFYKTVHSNGDMVLQSTKGTISIDQKTQSLGTITLKAPILDLSYNRSQIKTGQNLKLEAATLYLNNSRFVFGGFEAKSNALINMNDTQLYTVQDKASSGSISIDAPQLASNDKTELISERDLTLHLDQLNHSGQLAAGRDLSLYIQNDINNARTGLIYARQNGKILYNGTLTNQFGTIMSDGDLTFANLGFGKTGSFINTAGRIQSNGNLFINTSYLKNEADATPEISSYKDPEIIYDFEKPAGFERLGRGSKPKWQGILFTQYTGRRKRRRESNLFGTGQSRPKRSGFHSGKGADRVFWMLDVIYTSKEHTKGLATINGITYRAFTWKRVGAANKYFWYSWDDSQKMVQTTTNQFYKIKPKQRGLIKSAGDIILNVDQLDNHYSTIEGQKNVTITGNQVNNLGSAAYKIDYLTCKARETCTAFVDKKLSNAQEIINQDPQDYAAIYNLTQATPEKNIARNSTREVQRKITDEVVGEIKAGNNLNINANLVNNSPAEGSIAGHAEYLNTSNIGNPLEALNGLSGAASLFTAKFDVTNFNAAPNDFLQGQQDNKGWGANINGRPRGTNINFKTAELNAWELNNPKLNTPKLNTRELNTTKFGTFDIGNLSAPKPDSGGVGGTLPFQNFIYETRLKLLDVGTFYGSGYFIKRINYQPDRQVLFLGDAYFENELIDQQLRNLVGQGFGRGTFLPETDPLEQMKYLLDHGADYSLRHNLTFGDPLTKEQADNLEQTIVIYVKQQLNGIEVYAPVVYLSQKDKQRKQGSGTVLAGHNVTIKGDKLDNQGLILSSKDLAIDMNDIVAHGGGFAALGDITFTANKIDLASAKTTFNKGEVVLTSQNLSAGKNINLTSMTEITLKGVGIKAGQELNLKSNNIDIDVNRAKAGIGSENATGSNLKSGQNTEINARQDIKITGSKVEAGKNLTLNADNIDVGVSRTKVNRNTQTVIGSNLKSGQNTEINARQDIKITGSKVEAGKNLTLNADNIDVGVSRTKVNRNTQTVIGSNLKSGQNTEINARQDIKITGSKVEAGKNLTLNADNIDVGVSRTKVNRNTQTVIGSNLKSGQNTEINARQDIKITGSKVEAGKNLTLNAKEGDVLVTSAQVDQTIQTRRLGIFRKRLGTETIETHQESQLKSGGSTSINSGKDVTITRTNLKSGQNTEINARQDIKITGSKVEAGKNLTLNADNIDVGVSRTKVNRNTQTVIGSNLKSGQNTEINARQDIKITGSKVEAGKNLTLNADNIDVGVSRTKVNRNTQTVIGSNLKSGQNTEINARQDIKITGSKVEAGKNLTLNAKEGDVLVTSAQVDQTIQTRRLGIFRKRLGTETIETQHESNFKSGGATLIEAGKNIIIAGSKLNSNQDINLQANGSINLLATKNTRDQRVRKSGYSMSSHEEHLTSSHLIANGNIKLNTGTSSAKEDINVVASTVKAGENLTLNATGGINILSGQEHNVLDVHTQKKKRRLFGNKKSSSNTHTETIKIVKSDLLGDKGVSINSGDNITVNASNITAGSLDQKADLNLIAKGDVLIVANKETATHYTDSQTKRWYKKSSKNTNNYNENTISSNLLSSGDLTLKTDQNIVTTGSNLMAKQDVNLDGGSVTLAAAEEKHSHKTTNKKRGFGVGSGDGFVSIYGKNSKSNQDAQTKTVESQITSGRDINLIAHQTDINIIGGKINADQDINLMAKRDVNIASRFEKQSASRKEKNQGIGISFNIGKSSASVGFGYGKNAKKAQEEHDRNLKSQFKSMRDITILSGRDINIKGSDLKANFDVTLYAKNDVNLSAKRDKSSYSAQQEKIFAGITWTVQSNLHNAVDKIKQAVGDFKQGGSGILGIANTINGLQNGLSGTIGLISTGNNLKNELGKLNPNKTEQFNLANIGDNLVSVTTNIGLERQTHESNLTIETPVATTLTGGRTIDITAEKGDITSKGSTLDAGTNPLWQQIGDKDAGNITLTAGQDITLTNETQTTTYQAKGQVDRLGANINGNTVTPYFGHGKTKEKGTTTTPKNTEITATGDIELTSKGNTTLKGARVKGHKVSANIGGDLTIESVAETSEATLDTKTVAFDSRSLHLGKASSPKGGKDDPKTQYNKSQWLGYGKQNSSSHRQNVTEQSGIIAGEGGFDIKVTHNTDLKGGIISSTATPDKNILQTGSLTHSDLLNKDQAQSKSNHYAVPGGDIDLGVYYPLKTVVSNTLANSKKTQREEDTAKASVSPGTILITDEEAQHEKTGQSGAQTLATLDRDPQNANKQVGKADLKDLHDQVAKETYAKNEAINNTLYYTDDTYHTMFVKDHPLYRLVTDKEGKVVFHDSEEKKEIPLYERVSAEEEAHLKKGNNGVINIFTNGIFNDTDAAAKYANQMFNQKTLGNGYFRYFPQADTFTGELLVAAYQGSLDKVPLFNTNTTKKIRDDIAKYGRDNLNLYGHSRGTLTIDNALHEVTGDTIAENTKIFFFGGAANAQGAANELKRKSGGKQTYVWSETHKDDFVGVFIGGNPVTMEKIPNDSSKGKEWLNMFYKPESVHSCYGDSSDKCESKYGSSKGTKVFAE